MAAKSALKLQATRPSWPPLLQPNEGVQAPSTSTEPGPHDELVPPLPLLGPTMERISAASGVPIPVGPS